ncbi:MAG: hypothetical protein SCH98_01130 [Deferrisomatales bacterium]|nr:hypothetical protein [Deferrisomatales bacterium]
MILKPQDVLILLKLVSLGAREWSYARVAGELCMSASEVHAGVKRAIAARLMGSSRQRPILAALEEFLIHGVRYAFPPDRGGPSRGVPTAYAGPPLRDLITQPEAPPPVWPDPQGGTQGFSFSPLYRTVPEAAKRDRDLYELLVLTDAIRDGGAREREVSIRELRARLKS